jgi:GDP-L-fucose synthase
MIKKNPDNTSNLNPESLRLSPKSKIFIAGHNGMVGSAIWRNLESKGYNNIIGKSSKELDLRNQAQVETFFEKEKPDFVYLAAAKVGGILANDTYRAEFIYDNLQIQNNVIHQSYMNGVKKLLFLGSSCIYPRDCPQPMKEEYLLTGELEQTNEPYAIAKISGIKMCESYNCQYGTNFIAVMPTNLYGPGDNYDLETSHVLPALIRKFHEAKKANSSDVEVWGSGKPLREFLHVDDLADACTFLMKSDQNSLSSSSRFLPSLFNIGSGEEISIYALAILIKKITRFNGDIVFDKSKPDGTPRKLLDVIRINRLGWKSNIKLEDGIRLIIDVGYNK